MPGVPRVATPRGCWCAFCFENDIWRLVIHHKLPLQDGGTHAPDNLVTLCRRCHSVLHYFLRKQPSSQEGPLIARSVAAPPQRIQEAKEKADAIHAG